MKRMFAVVVLVVLVGQVFLVPSGGQAPYYAGKTIEIIVPFSPGGGTDLVARFYAPFLERHIPGNPRVIVRNMPGGGSIIGANWYAANAKPDGLTIFASSGSTVMPYLLGVPQVRYDFRKWKVVMSNGIGDVIYVSPRTGIRQPKDLLSPKEPLIFGSISPTSVDLIVLLVFELFHLNVRTVFGFEGRGPARLAFERGEINFNHDTTLSYISQVLPLVKEGKATPLMTVGFINQQGQVVRDPTLPDLPTVYEVYQELYGRKPDGLTVWKAYRAVLAAGYSFQKTYWVPQETPDAILRTLYDAVDRMRRDPRFQQEAQKVLEGYPLFRGDEVEVAIRRSMSPTLDVLKYMKDLVVQRYNVKF